VAAKKCAKKYGIKYLSVKELLNDKEIEVILNLTVPRLIMKYQVNH